MLISILSRRLKAGKTYEDFRRAWLPDRADDDLGDEPPKA